MPVTRHTRMAPAAIQKQWQRIFIQAYTMKEGSVPPTAATAGISPVYDFDPDTEQDVVTDVGIPLDWIAGTDIWAFPVFCTNVALFGTVRWGLQYLGMLKNLSIAAAPRVIEGNFAANGTAIVIPPKAEWLTLNGQLLYPGTSPIMNEPLFQRDNFTSLVNLQLKIYRAAASAFDNHPGNARLLGLALVYQAFI